MALRIRRGQEEIDGVLDKLSVRIAEGRSSERLLDAIGHRTAVENVQHTTIAARSVNADVIGSRPTVTPDSALVLTDES